MHKNVRFLDFLKSLKFRFIILITAVIVIPGVLHRCYQNNKSKF